MKAVTKPKKKKSKEKREEETIYLWDDLIKPLPSQRTFLESINTHEYILFGGSAGPGKSYILRWSLVSFLLDLYLHHGLTDVCVGLFCEDYPQLRERHISKIKREFPKELGEIKTTESEGLCFFLHEHLGGGRIALRNLDDPSKYASSEFAAIAVDELTKNDRQTFDDLRFRKRWPGVEHSPFIAASNPGSKGHAWVKKLWIDRDFSGDDANLDPSSFLFIPAKGKENPHLPQSYYDTLHSLPLQMRKAMEDGNWDIFVGQYFSDWNADLHTVSYADLPRSWKRIISFDYGFSAPSAVGWWCIDPEGTWWLYRELYRTGLTYPKLAEYIIDLTSDNEIIEYVTGDPAVWGDRQKHEEEIGLTGGEIMEKIFKEQRGWTTIKANHDRLQGWARCQELLRPFNLPEGRRDAKLKVFISCKNFIRTVPALVFDEHRVEDVDSDGEDHMGDMWRYAVNSRRFWDMKASDIKEEEYALVEDITSDLSDGWGGIHF